MIFVERAFPDQVIISCRPEMLTYMQEIFAVPEAAVAATAQTVEILTRGCETPVLIVDAAAPWADALLTELAGRAQPAVVAAFDQKDYLSDEAMDAIDTCVTIPAAADVAARMITLAIRKRIKATSARRSRGDTEAQLLQMAADFNQVRQRERAVSVQLERTLSTVEHSYLQTVEALALAVEAKDPYTGQHLQRVTNLASRLLRVVNAELATDPFISYGFLLHDIGKIGIPDSILLKMGPLTENEYETMKQHPNLGASIVQGVSFLSEAVGVIRHHHERWDGSGYPDGLKETEIPEAARVFAVADAVDAMLYPRPYRAPMSVEQACEEIRGGAGTQFDPAAADIFVSMVEAGTWEPAQSTLNVPDEANVVPPVVIERTVV